MKNIQKTIAALSLMTVFAFGTTFANTGIIVAGLTSNGGDPCTENVKVDNGIIVAGLTGIIVAGFTGIIVAGYTGDTKVPVNCGIIVAG